MGAGRHSGHTLRPLGAATAALVSREGVSTLPVMAAHLNYHFTGPRMGGRLAPRMVLWLRLEVMGVGLAPGEPAVELVGLAVLLLTRRVNMDMAALVVVDARGGAVLGFRQAAHPEIPGYKAVCVLA